MHASVDAQSLAKMCRSIQDAKRFQSHTVVVNAADEEVNTLEAAGFKGVEESDY